MPTRNVVRLALLALIVLIFLVVSPHAARQDTLQRNYGPLLEIDALVRRHYVEPVDPEQLARGAITGLMGTLDRFSHYLSPAAFAAFQRRLAGEDIGIGIKLEMADNQPTARQPTARQPTTRQHAILQHAILRPTIRQPTIRAVIDGSLASEAGLRTGDVVLAIDGESTVGKSLLEVEGLTGGAVGSSVELSLRRAGVGGEDESFSVTILREARRMEYVRGIARRGTSWRWMLDDRAKIGYVRIGAFRDTTSADFEAALKALGDQGVKGLILDLRFNPGGIVAEAVTVVDHFVPKGVIVQTISRDRAGDIYRAHLEHTDVDLPLVVLVNGSSASAAEIVTGSLQDHQRATVVGSRTFGKGSVQYILKLAGSAGALRLTSAYYVLPSGRIVHRTPANVANDSWGITPDVVIELDEPTRHALIENRRLVDRVTNDGTATSPSALSVQADPQLSAALDLLRSQLRGATQTP